MVDEGTARGSRAARLARRARTLGLLALTALACRPAASSGPTDAGPPPTREPEASDGADPRRSGQGSSCGTPGGRFDGYGWTPASARLLTSIDLEHGELAPAFAQLQILASHAELAALPIFAALDFGQLGLAVANLERMLSELGLAPGELVELHGPAGEIVWIWPTDCAPELLATRVLSVWGVMLRAVFHLPGARLGTGDQAGFPFDVLVFSDRVALTNLGRGADVLEWLRTPPPLGANAPAPASASLAELEPAPLRSAFVGESLLAGARQASAEPRTVRVTAAGVELDGEPWRPPATGQATDGE